MPYNFTICDRNQSYLLPPDMADWLPESHLAWFIIDAVKEMDLTPFYSRYRADGKGQKAYHPAAIVTLLLYGYCNGERSSRKLEKFCHERVDYRVVSGDSQPNYSSLCRFRQRHEVELKSIFMEVLRLCACAGVLKVGKVSLDGTKLKANASLAANRTEKKLAEEISRMLAEAAARDTEEDERFGKDKRGDELPEELCNRRSRLARLKQCKERLAQERSQAERKQLEKLEKRAAEEHAAGKKKRGRKPKKPEEAGKKDTKANVTEPESRIMKTRSGYVQGYNAQAVVTDEQYVLAPGLTQEANDLNQLHPRLEQAQANVSAVLVGEKIKAGRADAGYCSEENLSREIDIELFVATKKDWKRRKELREQGSPQGRIPKAATATERMERKLLTKRGHAFYKKRSQTVEPVFGQIKDARGIDRFMRRGFAACESEWSLICATHNLLKLWRSGKPVRN